MWRAIGASLMWWRRMYLSAPGRIGQSGWTWYTGSAAWMYRIWIEEVLGFRLRGDRFTVEPSMPADWPGFELTYRHGSTVYEITVSRQDDASRVRLAVGNRWSSSRLYPGGRYGPHASGYCASAAEVPREHCGRATRGCLDSRPSLQPLSGKA